MGQALNDPCMRSLAHTPALHYSQAMMIPPYTLAAEIAGMLELSKPKPAVWYVCRCSLDLDTRGIFYVGLRTYSLTHLLTHSLTRSLAHLDSPTFTASHTRVAEWHVHWLTHLFSPTPTRSVAARLPGHSQ